MTTILYDFYETYRGITGEDFEGGPTQEYIDLLKQLPKYIKEPIQYFSICDNAPVLWHITEENEEYYWYYYDNDFSEYDYERDSHSWDKDYPLEDLFRALLNKDSSKDFVGFIC